jgi:hypothetical protein
MDGRQRLILGVHVVVAAIFVGLAALSAYAGELPQAAFQGGIGVSIAVLGVLVVRQIGA